MDGNGSLAWVLIAEDDEAVRQTLVELLLGADFRVNDVSDGAAALEFLHRCGDDLPDVLLTDLDMPRLSGADLITVLRNDPDYRRLSIVVLSSFDGRTPLPVFQVERLLAKPFTGPAVVRVLSELVALKRQSSS